MRDKKGFLALLCNGIFLGTYGIWVRFFQNSLTAYQQVTLRGSIGLLLAFFIALFLKTHWGYNKKYNKNVVFYLFSFALSTIFFTLGVLRTSVALAVFGLYVGSILSAFIIGAVYFQEKITKTKFISILCVLLALVAFIFPFKANFFISGLLISILSGVFDGIGNAFKKYFGGKIQRPALIVYQTVSTLVVALGFIFFMHQPIIPPQLTLTTILMMAIYSIIFVAVAYLSMYGFQHFNLNLGTIIISSELFWAPFFAFLIFHETLTIYQILGGILITIAILVPYTHTYFRHISI